MNFFIKRYLALCTAVAILYVLDKILASQGLNTYFTIFTTAVLFTGAVVDIIRLGITGNVDDINIANDGVCIAASITAAVAMLAWQYRTIPSTFDCIIQYF